jgi:hypothetical protein
MSQAFQCPRIGRPAMHESERRSDVRVAQARQPPASVLRQHVEVPAHHVDEHQLCHAGQNGLAAGTPRRRRKRLCPHAHA